MINPDMLCMGCMKSTGAQICPECGFDRQDYEKNRPLRILPTKTVLHGRYLVGKTLGIGGFGITYLALDLVKEEKIAVKEYFPNGLAERTVTGDRNCFITVSGDQQRLYYQKGLNSFVKEATTMSAFKNLEGIVQVHDFFRENNTAYLVMEYLPGMSLRSYVKISGLPLNQNTVLEMIWPVLNSLAMIHRKGIVHRDISPDNIIYGPDHSITLIDFGAARQGTSDSNKSLTIMLKHGYAPMEQYYTQGKQGPWTDIYAICATVYYLLSGIVPPDSISRFADDSLRPLKEVNHAVSSQISVSIQKGLAVKFEDRYQTVEDLITDLYAGMYVDEAEKRDDEKQPEKVKAESDFCDLRWPEEKQQPGGESADTSNHAKESEGRAQKKKRKILSKTGKLAEKWRIWDSLLSVLILLLFSVPYIQMFYQLDIYFITLKVFAFVISVAAVFLLIRQISVLGWTILLPAAALSALLTENLLNKDTIEGIGTFLSVYLINQISIMLSLLSILWMIWYFCLNTGGKKHE